MHLTRRRVGVGVGLVALAIGIAYVALRSGHGPATALAHADERLHAIEVRTPEQIVLSRCSSGDAFIQRACHAIRDVSSESTEPLAAATRLQELSKSAAGTGPPTEVLEAVQALRVQLLIKAGHSREAAVEAQAWAEARGDEPSSGAVRLWLAAASAQQAMGDDEISQADAHHALRLADSLQ